MADNSDLLPYIDRLKTARVLCIGDVMLDHYIYGRVERVSPEAPIPVMCIEREMKTLGGAGNVLRNLRALGAAASFISVVGNDDAGREIGRLLEAQDGAEVHVLVQPQRTTTVKTRYVAANQQLLRADRESAIPLDPYIREDLLRLAREIGDRPFGGDHLRLCQRRADRRGGARDYPRGARGGRMCHRRSEGRRPDPLSRRRPAETEPARTGPRHGHAGGDRDEIIAACARADRALRLRRRLASLGAKGWCWLPPTARCMSNGPKCAKSTMSPAPATPWWRRSAAALGVGVGLIDAARLGNIAAGIVVGKVGTAVVYASELAACLDGRDRRSDADKVMSRAHALDLVARWRRQGLRIGFTNGCFDLLHPGHVALLRQAKAACDRLVVGLNSDASAARLKGPRRPVQSESARAAVLASLAAVDLVVIFEEDTPIELIRRSGRSYWSKGADYRSIRWSGADYRQERRRGAARQSRAGLQHDRDWAAARALRLAWLDRPDQIPSNRRLRDRGSAAAVPPRRGQSARSARGAGPASSFVVLPSRSSRRRNASATIRPHSSGISTRGNPLATAK